MGVPAVVSLSLTPPPRSPHAHRHHAPRLVHYGETVGPAPRGRMPTPLPAVWPAKDPGEMALYAADLARILPAGDSIAQVDVAIAPDEPGGLAYARPQVLGSVVTLWLGGGNDGSLYIVELLLTLASGQTLVAAPQIPVVQLLPALLPVPCDVLTLNGDPLTVAGQPITITAADTSAPLTVNGRPLTIGGRPITIFT